jgi:uncharacterized cupredoxin-like copper-binding protein
MQGLISLAIMITIGSVLVAVFLQRKTQMLHGAHDTAMTVAMALGMVAGLAGGIIGGLLAPDDLWVPTVIGSLAGVGAGVATGLQGGLMAVLEGVMSGVMAGTMGAMMGGMMPARGVPLVLGLAGLSAATGTMTSAMLWPKGHAGHGMVILPGRSLAVIIAVVGAAGMAAWFGTGPLVHRLPITEEHRHVTPLAITVKAGEYGFSPQVVEMPQGQTVRLVLENDGQQEHDLTVPGLEYRLAARRDRRAEPPGLHLFAGPGETESLEIVALRPGDFAAYCSVAGHKDLGMALVIRVVSGSGQ